MNTSLVITTINKPNKNIRTFNEKCKKNNFLGQKVVLNCAKRVIVVLKIKKQWSPEPTQKTAILVWLTRGDFRKA